MRIGVPRETRANERRVGLTPDSVKRLIKAGYQVTVENGAGAGIHQSDDAYREAGAQLSPSAEVYRSADILVKVQPPTAEEVGQVREGATLISLLNPAQSASLFESLASRKVTALAMELVPRTTLAQSMDVLSSQATVAGYKAVLLGASELGKLLPMLTTAAGTLAPSKVFVIGAGVAGLQAIATAKRLGAIVSAFDVRPVVREQVQSLGASFIAAEEVAEAEGAGGYAKELAEEQQKKVLEAVGGHLPDMDLVITTAQIPGKPAPTLITDEMLQAMKPGAVVVDLASETGGNCVATRMDETVQAHGVTVMGPVNLPASVPEHASQMYSRNLTTLVEYLTKDGDFHLDLEDPVAGPMVVVAEGSVRYGRDA